MVHDYKPVTQRRSPWPYVIVAALVAVAVVVALAVAVFRPGEDAPPAAAPSATQEPEETASAEPDETPTDEPTGEETSGEGPAAPPSGVPSEGVPQAGLADPDQLETTDSVTVRDDGEVLEDLLVRGTINIKADDVVIRNVRLETGTDAYALRIYDGFGGTVIENVEIALPTDKCSNAGIYGGRDLTVRYTEITGCGDGLKVSSGSVYEYNDIRLSNSDGSGKHLDGMQNSGASNVVIRGNHISVPAEDGGNAAIFTHSEFSDVEDVLIEGNYLNGGNYTVFVEDAGTSGVRILGNHFGRDFRYGLFRIRDTEVITEDNVWDDSLESV